MLILELISRTKDGIKADLKSGAGAVKRVNFKNEKNLDKDNARTNIRDGTNTKIMVDFRDKIITIGINIYQFSAKSVNAITGPVDIQWSLQDSLSNPLKEK